MVLFNRIVAWLRRSVIDTATNNVIATIKAGYGPWGIAP